MTTRLLALTFLVAMSVMASPALDERYALRKTAAVVLDADTATVYAEQLQTQLSTLVRANPRFEWSDEAFLLADDWLRKNPQASASFEPWQPLFDELRRLGTQSLLVAQLVNGDDGYALKLRLITVMPPQMMAQAQVPIPARPTIANLNEGARAAWDELLRGIPFDATILRREGYRVVLDRGRPSFREGIRLSAYTLETEEGAAPGAPLQMVETGLVQITHVENDLAFRRIVVEWKPREVLAGNKIRVASSPIAAEKGPLFPQLDIPMLDAGRVPPALATAELRTVSDGGPFANPPTSIRAAQAKLGTVALDLVGQSLAMDRTDAASAGGALHSQSSFFPGASLRAEAYLTRTWFGGISYGFGLGGWNDAAGGRLNGSYSQLRLEAGYRWNMLGSDLGPSLRGRFGYSTTHFGVNPSSDPTVPTGASYRGILVGGDFVFPFTARFGFGLEGNAVLFPGFSEDNGTSGAKTSGVSAWDFALSAYYQLDPMFRLDTRFLFQTFSANFSGVGTGAANLSALSTGGRALLVGVTYGF